MEYPRGVMRKADDVKPITSSDGNVIRMTQAASGDMNWNQDQVLRDDWETIGRLILLSAIQGGWDSGDTAQVSFSSHMSAPHSLTSLDPQLERNLNEVQLLPPL
jgi:hypothetical protein